MIHEVDVALRSLIEREATAGTDVEVLFDAPTKDWAGRRNVPTIDVYLYDIREDLRRRERGLINEYDERDRVRARHLPPRHFKLSYLVTAWTQRPEDEHRLLSALLTCFLRFDAIPPELLTGPLADLALPVPLTVALPPPEDRSFADVWSALGGELKPSLDVVVSAPTPTGQQYHAGPPVVAPPTISLGGTGRSAGAPWPPREERQGHVALAGWPLALGPDGVAGGAPGSGGPDRDGVDGGGPDGGSEGRGADGASGTGRAAGRRAPGQASGKAGRGKSSEAAGGTVAMVRGLTWRELAESGRRPAGPDKIPDKTQDPDQAEPASETDRAPKPRRRRGGVEQK